MINRIPDNREDNDIRLARLAAGLTQQAMSDLLEIPIQTIKDWDRGARIPPKWVAKLIIEKLDKIK